MPNKQAFFRFDFGEDFAPKVVMAGQITLPESPFNAADWSMKKATPERNWERETEARLRRCGVVVLAGPKAHSALGALKRVSITGREGWLIVQVIADSSSIPAPLPNADRFLHWTWGRMTSVLG